MKDYFNLRKSKWLLAALIAIVVGASPAWAEEVTVYDGTANNQYLPVYGYYADSKGTISEYIIPSSDLTALNGKTIEKLVFYLQSPASASWGSASFNIYLEEVEGSNYDDSSASQLTDSKTLVYAGALDGTGSTMEIPFTTNYTYNGGNLLVAIEVGTAGTYKDAKFYGTTTTSNTGRYKANSTGRAKFIPKTTFVTPTNGPALTVKDGNKAISSPYAFNFGLATAGTTKTFTLSNPGTEGLGISVSETGSFGATLSATTIAAGGEATLTVTMPEATGNSAVTITPAAGSGIDPFVINVSGTIRDANKLYEYGFTALPTDWMTTGSWYYSEANGAYTTSWYLSSNARLITPKLTVAEGETFFVEAKGYSTSNTSYQHLQMQYSADGSTWTNFDSEPTLDPSNWKTFAFTGVPAGNYYIAINASQADIRMFYGGQLPLEPRMVVTQPASLDFGVITEATAKTFTIANTGKATLESISVTSSNSSIFAITGAPTSLAAGASAEVTITMSAATTGALSSDITVSATAMEDVKFTVTGVVLPEGMMVVDFNDNQLPANWTNASWTFANGEATGKSSSAYLTTPKLIFSDGDMLVIKAKRADSDATDYITVVGSSDNGSTWTAYSKKISGSNGLAYPDYGTIVLSDIPTAVNKLRFVGYYVVVDEISGLTYAPTLTVTKDEDVVTTPAAYDFGECSANASVTYNFANTGAGTINITNVAITGDGAAAYSTNWTESVAAPFDLTVTRTYDADRTEAQAAVITVTTTDGDFVINVTGTDRAAGAFFTINTDGSAQNLGIVAQGGTAEKTFTITNEGSGDLSVAFATPADFSVKEASPMVIAASESKSFTIAINTTSVGQKSGDVVLTFDASNATSFTIPVSGIVTAEGSETADFNDNALPNRWGNEASNKWSFASGYAYCTASSSSPAELVTKKVDFSGSDFIVVKVKAHDSGSGDFLTIEGSSDNGATYEAFTKTLSYNNSDFGSSSDDWTTIIVNEIPSTVNKLKFKGYYIRIDEIAGLKYSAQDPQIAIYNDAEATSNVTSGTIKDFGWAQTAQTATYYIKNSGTGTLTISDIATAEGFTAATTGDVKTLDAGAAPLALTITMTDAVIGAKNGTITLTTDGGNFEIPVKGFIYGDKNMVDFTDAAQYTGWTGVNVTDGVASLSSTAIETTPFAAEAGEKLYVELKGSSSYGSKSFAYSYSSDNGATWSAATSLVESTYGNVDDQVFTISDIANAEEKSTVQIRFTGSNLGINRIYGFTALKVPVMALDKTASSYNFGMQTANADYVITVTNNGTATMNNLAATLETGKNYSVVITKPEGESTTTIDDGKATVPVGQSAVITVTQVYDAANGLASLSDVLTISADDVLSKTVSVSGQTRDASKWYVDFASGIPSTFIEKGSWSYSSQQGYVYDESALVSQTLTIAANEKIQFDVKTMSYSTPSLKVRHSINGGLSWSDYTDLTNEEGVNSSTYTTLQYSCGNTDASAVAMIEFLGANVYLDNIYGGTLNNETPMIQVKKGSTIVKNGEATEEFGTILEAKSAEYTIYNIGSGTMTITETIETTGGATATISATSLGAGESATLTITMPVVAPYGEKSGAVTVETSLGDFVINYTATTMDPDALNITFNDYTLPTGWYVNGWSNSYSQYLSRTERNSDASFISQKLKVAGKDDILKFDAQKYGSYYASSTVLKVSYSTDRVNWTEIGDYASEMTTSWKTFSISGLEAGEYYLKFTGRYANVDNIIGWKKVSGIEHDLFVTATNIPANATINEELSITATVTSLIAAETGVYAKLFIDDEEVATATPATADIALRGSQTFAMAYTAPSTAGTHKAQVKIYFSNGDEAFATAETDLEVSWPALTLDESETNTIEEGTFNVTLKRQFAEGWNTVCLPFAINDIEGVFGEGAKAYAFVNYDNGVIGFQKTTEIDAATPYVLYVPSAITEDMLFSNATISSTTSGSVEQNGAIFRGTYAPVAAGEWTKDADSDVIYGVTGQGKIAKAGANASIDGFRAYFDLPANASASRLSFIDEDGTTTIINGIVMDKTTDENVYNLNGQRVETLKKGNLYIINGKKVIRK